MIFLSLILLLLALASSAVASAMTESSASSSSSLSAKSRLMSVFYDPKNEIFASPVSLMKVEKRRRLYGAFQDTYWVIDSMIPILRPL